MNQEQNKNVVPTTPETAVLPKDQALNVTANIPTQVEAVQTAPAINQANPNEGMISPPPVVTPPPTNPIAQGIQNGTLINKVDDSIGIREGNQALPPEKKKTGGKFLLIVIFLILLIGGIGAGIIWYTQFKTIEKRFDTVLSNIFSFTNNIDNDTFEKKSGSYNINLNLDFNDKSYEIEADGKYAYDLTQSFNTTVNIKTLNLDEKILTTPLATDVYLYDGNAYFLLENFYDKYIFTEASTFKNITDYINQNNIDYVKTKNSLVGITKNSIKKMGYTPSIENIDGYKNVITIPINERTIKNFLENFNTELLNNNELTNHIIKALDLKKNEFEKLLSRNLNNFSYQGNGYIKIVTSLFDKKLHSINISIKEDTTTTIDIVEVQNGYKINIKEDNKSIVDLEYTKTLKKTTSTDEKEITLKGSFSGNVTNNTVNNILPKEKDETAYSFEIKYINMMDVTPKVEKINLRDAVRYDNISIEDMKIIISKIKEFGNLPHLLENYGIDLDSVLPEEEIIETPDENITTSEVVE